MYVFSELPFLSPCTNLCSRFSQVEWCQLCCSVHSLLGEVTVETRSGPVRDGSDAGEKTSVSFCFVCTTRELVVFDTRGIPGDPVDS